MDARHGATYDNYHTRHTLKFETLSAQIRASRWKFSLLCGLVLLWITARNPLWAEEQKPVIALSVLVDVEGKEHVIAHEGTALPVVLAWTAGDCPMAKVYAPRLRALAQELAGRGVRVFLVDSSSDVTAEALRQAVKGQRGKSVGQKVVGLKVEGVNAEGTKEGGSKADGTKEEVPMIADAKGELARLLGARSTTDAVVLDGLGRVAYRGAVDDQYGFRRDDGGGTGSYRKDAPTKNFVREAVEALLEGKAPAVAETDPMGCLLEWTPAPVATKEEIAGAAAAAGGVAADAPVFYGGVERVFREHCQECHFRGGTAPFALETYDDVRRRSRTIREVLDERRMPPWSASPEHGHFANDPSLSVTDMATVKRWLRGGLARGDEAKKLPPVPPRDEWQIGTPDMIIETEPFTVAAEGRLPYRYLRIPTNFTEDRWVEATQILSDPPGIVHHVLIFTEKHGPAPAGTVRPWTPRWDPVSLLEGAKPQDRWKWIIRFAPIIATDLPRGDGGGLNGSFATSLSAGRGMIYPPGRAKLLAAGATLVLQIHYTPDGTAHETKTRLGLRFAKTPPAEPVDSRSLATVAFQIPPGEKAAKVVATKVMPRDALLLSLRPHMHLRGKSFRYVAEYPDGGGEEILLDVPKWDFEWQVEYVLAEPKRLPRGTKLRAEAVYDNSAENEANPNPEKTVYFGLQSEDEMMIGYYEVVWLEEPKSAAVSPEGKPVN